MSFDKSLRIEVLPSRSGSISNISMITDKVENLQIDNSFLGSQITPKPIEDKSDTAIKRKSSFAFLGSQITSKPIEEKNDTAIKGKSCSFSLL